MARHNRKTELLSHLRTVELILADTAAAVATTLTAAGAVGASTLTVASITGLAVGQTIRVGRGEAAEIVKVHASTAPSGNTVTLDPETPLQVAHDVGEAVVKQQILNLGAVHGDGVSLSWDGEPTDIAVENQAFLHAQKTGHMELMLEFGLIGMMAENLSAALGFLLAKITGAGTAASPREFYLDFTDPDSIINEETDCCWRLTGVRKDKTVCQYDAFACEIDPTGFALELGRGVNAKVPVRLKVTGGILQRTWL